MCNSDESLNFPRMIEDKQLLKLKEVILMYNLTKEEIVQAVRSHGISKPIKCFGAEYYFTEELDLFTENTLDGLIEE